MTERSFVDFVRWQLLTRAWIHCSMVHELQVALGKAELTMNSSSAVFLQSLCLCMFQNSRLLCGTKSFNLVVVIERAFVGMACDLNDFVPRLSRFL